MIRWLASYPKSGNTWARYVLNAYICGKNFDFREMPKHFLIDVHSNFYRHLIADGMNPTMPQLMLLRGAALVLMCHPTVDPVVKTHCCNRILDNIELIPASVTESAVFIVRDPRDVVISFADHFGKSIDDALDDMANEDFCLFAQGEKHKTQFTSSWSEHALSWADRADFPIEIVRYEDMKSKPLETFRRIVHAMNIEYDERRLKFALKATEFSKLQAYEKKYGFAEKSKKSDKFFRSGRAGGWRDILTNSQHERIWRDHGDVMERFGYTFPAKEKMNGKRYRWPEAGADVGFEGDGQSVGQGHDGA